MRFIKDYFDFTTREYNAFAILIFIILLLTIANYYQSNFYTIDKVDFSEFEDIVSKYYQQSNTINENVVQLFYFDPNNTTNEEWKQLGLEDKSIVIINKYLDKGGRFYKKEQLKKVYGINSQVYSKLEPYIVIKKKKYKKSNYRSFDDTKSQKNYYSKPDYEKKDKEFARLNIEINSTNYSSLTRIKGIGSLYVNRILKYRNMLGGFYKKEQLWDVYDMSEEIYEKIVKHIDIDTSSIKKIPINLANCKELFSHPYIRKKANKIIKYRNTNGAFGSIYDLTKYDIISKKEFERLRPYLSLW